LDRGLSLRILGLVTLLGLPGLVDLVEARPPAASAPATNVVVYLIDTLRRDRLGVYGDESGITPHLDALARESVVFDRAFSSAPWTLPSVVSLMTSTHPVDHQVLVRGQQIGRGLVPLAERMQRVGYRTGAFVANPLGGKASGLDRGFDRLERVSPAPDLDRVDGWLDEDTERPFFLYVHTTEPHRPYRSPADLRERFEAPARRRLEGLHRLMRDYRTLTRVDFDAGRPLGETDNTEAQREALAELTSRRDDWRRAYDASVAWGDRNLGALIERLRARGEWDETLLIVLSDHGEELLDHGQALHGQSLYPELVHVPMLWKLPGGRGGGQRVASTVGLVDVVPTLFDWLGRPEAAEGVLGRSFAARFGGGEEPAASPRVTAVRLNRVQYYRPEDEARGRFNLRVSDGMWQGIWNVDRDRLELYDHRNDPTELRDLAKVDPARAAALRSRAKSFLDSRPELADVAPSGGSPSLEHLDAETRERLQALGYVE